jgi:hypothetical protein
MITPYKKIYSPNLLLISLIILLALTGCARSTPAPSANCVPPPVKVAFPHLVFQKPGDALPTHVLPPEGWKPQLGDEQSKKLHTFDSVQSIIAQSSDDIWVATYHALVRYRPRSGELITYWTFANFGVSNFKNRSSCGLPAAKGSA